MENHLIKSYLLPASLCDNTARLSIPDIFSLFMDLASEHGAAMHLGMDDLAEKGLIWLTLKTKIRIFQRPKMLTQVTARTWPEAPGKIRCNRHYVLTDGEHTLIEGKTEWAMLAPATGKLHKISDAYPVQLEHCPDLVCEGPFAKVSDDFSNCEELQRYTVCSRDIDVSQHMNNVAYVRVLLGALSCKTLEELHIREAEALYRVQCYEGETLSIRRRAHDTGFDLAAVKADGSTAAVLRLVTET